MPIRKPNPFLPFYAPRWMRMPGAAKLEGTTIDLAEVFRVRPWTELTKIEVVDPETGRPFYPWREGDMFENTPYKGSGSGYMSREELASTAYDDADLERLSRQLFKIPLDLSGEDTPEKRFLRENAYDRIVAAETGQIVP